ncbi:MAG: hypothetical protein WA294_08030 [Acidobacteriaceae bacterium]
MELALKACIAKQTKRHQFPDKKIALDSYTHDFKKLASIAKLDEARIERSNNDETFRRNWDLSTLWSEESRYRTTDKATCKAFLDAIIESEHGLIPWIKQVW